eukprot:PhM_4_TR10782/c0_g1_i1/m.76857/K10088/OS9; protein OS-9
MMASSHYLLYFSVIVILTCGVAAASSPSLSSPDPTYNVDFLDSRSELPTDFSADTYDNVQMKTAIGAAYECYVPRKAKANVPAEASEKPKTSTEAILTDRQRKAIEAALDKQMSGTPESPNEPRCLRKTVGWWSYDMCWKQHVRQYHVNEQAKKVEAEYYLGKSTTAVPPPMTFMPASSSSASTKASSPYVAWKFSDGTVCDLTLQPRETEVRVMCNALAQPQPQEDFAFDVHEHSTCKYIVNVYLSSLCTFDAFKPKPVHRESIYCVAKSI